MADEDLLVILRPPDNQRSHQRSSYTAAADVAHEVDYSRGAVALFGEELRYSRRDGNEKKSNPHYLRDAQPRCKTEADE